ncbi:MAG: trigger factor [Bacteroidota bacterium]
MEITRENTGELTATIKMVISPADHQESVTKILKDYQRKANVPGFRPGHVPFGMIKKLYGGAVFAEEVNKLISDKLHEYITEEKLDIIGQPLPNTTLTPELDWKEGQNLDFYFDLGFTPKFDFVLDENIAVDYHVIKVDDTMVDKYLADMRQRFGTMTNPEVSSENDVLYGEFLQLDAEGNDLEEGIIHSAKIAIDTISEKEVQGKLIGLKVGETAVFNPLKATGNAVEAAAMLGITRDEVEGMESDFKYTVSEISAMSPAEMNEEFYNKVFPDMGISSEEEFRNQVRNESEKAFIADSDHLFAHHSQDKLVECTEINLPNEFMKRWLVESNEGKLTAEDIERDYDKYVESMKWQLIENKIILEAGIEVADEEIKDYVKDYYLQGWRTMPLTDDLMERLDTIADSFLTDKPKEVRQIVDSLYGQRVTAYIKSKVNLVKKEITYDEFINLDAQKH